MYPSVYTTVTSFLSVNDVGPHHTTSLVRLDPELSEACRSAYPSPVHRPTPQSQLVRGIRGSFLAQRFSPTRTPQTNFLAYRSSNPDQGHLAEFSPSTPKYDSCACLATARFNLRTSRFWYGFVRMCFNNAVRSQVSICRRFPGHLREQSQVKRNPSGVFSSRKWFVN